MGKMSTGARSINLLRKHGFAADNVERRNRYVANDFLGCIDLIGVRGRDRKIIGVQATSRSHRATRVRKIMETPEIVERVTQWLEAGCELEVWSWGKLAGKRNYVLGRDLIYIGRDGELATRRVDEGFEV